MSKWGCGRSCALIQCDLVALPRANMPVIAHLGRTGAPKLGGHLGHLVLHRPLDIDRERLQL